MVGVGSEVGDGTEGAGFPVASVKSKRAPSRSESIAAKASSIASSASLS